MKITVGIPCYNQGEYLEECLDSVFKQTIKPHEIILVSDGSQDQTRYIAHQYPEVKYIEQVNKGLASARNTVIMNMTGDYLLPLDADDKQYPNCVEVISKKIEETNADVIAPSFRCFGMSDQEVVLMDNPGLQDFKVANRIGYFSAIKKEALLEIGGYSPRMIHGYEDYHLWINLLSRGKKIVTIRDILMFYRTKQNSMITDAQKHHSELMTQIHKDFPSW